MPFFNVEELKVVQAAEGTKRRAVFLDNLMLTFFDLEPGAVVPSHQHPHEQITLVLEGKIAFTLGEENRILGEGEGAAIPPGIVHGVKTLAPSRVIDAWHPVREDYK
jgi:quercetin dioxygenase-like cupin family protein